MEAVVALVVTVMNLLREDYMLGTKAGFLTIVSILASMTLYFVHDGYPPELISLAQQAGGPKAFWCGLSVYGRQASLLHTLTAVFGFGIASLLMLPSTSIFGFFAFFSFEVTQETYDKLQAWTSWGPIVVSAVLLFVAIYAHSPDGWDLWKGLVVNPPTGNQC